MKALTSFIENTCIPFPCARGVGTKRTIPQGCLGSGIKFPEGPPCTGTAANPRQSTIESGCRKTASIDSSQHAFSSLMVATTKGPQYRWSVLPKPPHERFDPPPPPLVCCRLIARKESLVRRSRRQPLERLTRGLRPETCRLAPINADPENDGTSTNTNMLEHDTLRFSLV